MSQLSEQERVMFTRYYGDKRLEANDSFWADVWDVYCHTDVPIPIEDDHINRRWLAGMLECEQCGECCASYPRLLVTDKDIARLPGMPYRREGDNSYLNIKDGCCYLENGKCSVWEKRPDGCVQWPIVGSTPAVVNGTAMRWLVYRVGCLASVKVLRDVMRRAARGGYMLLPDLSLVARSEAQNVK